MGVQTARLRHSSATEKSMSSQSWRISTTGFLPARVPWGTSRNISITWSSTSTSTLEWGGGGEAPGGLQVAYERRKDGEDEVLQRLGSQ